MARAANPLASNAARGEILLPDLCHYPAVAFELQAGTMH